MLYLRNEGYSVVGVHHANKPQVQGSGINQGAEAGSTNQLTVLETQMRVTQIFPDTQDGMQRAEEVRGVVDANGYQKIQEMKALAEGSKGVLRIKTAIRVSYGKVRRMTDAHKTTYIGFAEDANGQPVTISTRPIRQRIKWQSENGHSLEYLADFHNVGGENDQKLVEGRLNENPPAGCRNRGVSINNKGVFLRSQIFNTSLI